MGKRRLARAGADAAADHRRHRGGMMRGAEGPAGGQLAVRKRAGDRGDHRHFQELGRRQGRQERGEPRRQHRLAGAGRADHEEMMAAGGGDLERALGRLLALDVGEIRQRPDRIDHARLGPRQDLGAAEMIGDRDQAARGEDRHGAARPGRLRAAGQRTDQAAAERVGRDRRRQRAGDRCDGAVERQFADRDEVAELVARQRAERRHQGKRDRQVVVAAFLGQVGRGEIDDDPLVRQRQAAGMERRRYPVAALVHGLVRQADNAEIDLPRRDVHLDIDRHGLDALKRNRRDV